MKTFAVIDIGSSFVSGMLAQKDQGGLITPLDYHFISSSNFTRKGLIHNIDKAEQAIQTILDKLNQHPILCSQDARIGYIYVGINPLGLKAETKRESYFFETQMTISKEFIEQQNKIAEKISYQDRDIIFREKPIFHIPERITQPLGEVCQGQIFVDFTTVSVPKNTLSLISQIFNKLNVKVEKFIPNPIAEFYATSISKPHEIINCFVNIGGGNTTISVFRDEQIQYLYTYPFGGSNITKDIATVLDLENREEAEKLKIENAKAFDDNISFERNNQEINTSKGHIQLAKLDEIVYARVYEIMCNVRKILNENHNNDEQQKRYITFSGESCRLKNFDSLIYSIFPTKSRTFLRLTSSEALFPEDSDKKFQLPQFKTLIGLVSLAEYECETATNDIFEEKIIEKPLPPQKEEVLEKKTIPEEIVEEENNNEEPSPNERSNKKVSKNSLRDLASKWWENTTQEKSDDARNKIYEQSETLD